MEALKMPTGKQKMRTKTSKPTTTSRRRFSCFIRLVCRLRLEVLFIDFFQFIVCIARRQFLRHRIYSLLFLSAHSAKETGGTVGFLAVRGVINNPFAPDKSPFRSLSAQRGSVQGRAAPGGVLSLAIKLPDRYTTVRNISSVACC